MKLPYVFFVLILICICISPVMAVNITSSDVTYTNIYGSTIYNISSSGTYDGTSTETDITNVVGRYVYAVSLSSSATAGGDVDYTISGLQGATVLTGSDYPLPGWSWDYGDTHTADTFDLFYTYSESGTYITNLTLRNSLDTTGITLSTSITLTGPTISSITVLPTIGSTITQISLRFCIERHIIPMAAECK